MPTETPRVSVLMGVYNGLPYVRDAIESILKQEYADFELLVVDDCSTDGTRAELEAIADTDDRVRLLRNDENRGLTWSLNRALREAKGEYVARHDADDLSAPSRLRRQVTYLDDHPHVAVVGSSAHIIDDSNDVIDTRIVLETLGVRDLEEKNHMIHGSVLARRSVLQRHDGYDNFFEFSQDYDLWLRLSKSHKLRNLSDPLYFLREHTGSIYFSRMKQSSLYAMLARGRSTGRFSSETVSQVRENGIDSLYELLTPAEKAELHRSLAKICLRYGRTEDARTQLRTALDIEAGSPKTYVLLGLSRLGTRPLRALRALVRRGTNTRNRLRNRI